MTAPMSARDGSAFSGYKVNQNILQHDTIMEHQYMNEGMCGFFRIFAHATNQHQPLSLWPTIHCYRVSTDSKPALTR